MIDFKLTRRQRMILEDLQLAHSAGLHLSPRHLANRISIGTEGAMRRELAKLLMAGFIVDLIPGKGSAPAKYKLNHCGCKFCNPS